MNLAIRLTSIAAVLSLSSIAFGAERDVQVSASVKQTCKVTSHNDIAFGELDPSNAVDVSASGNVVFRCTKGTAYVVSANNGANHDGTTRRMAGGGEFLPYSMEASGLTGTGNGFGAGSAVTVPLTASILGTSYEDLPGTNFSDTLQVTITP